MTSHLSKRLRIAAFLSIAMLALSASCQRPRSTPSTPPSNEVSNVSQALVGKQITIRGKFSLLGKPGAYVVLDNQQLVYLEPSGSFTWGKPYSELEGKLVAATGTLKLFHTDFGPGDQAVQIPPDHFYFEAESTQLRLISP